MISVVGFCFYCLNFNFWVQCGNNNLMGSHLMFNNFNGGFCFYRCSFCLIFGVDVVRTIFVYFFGFDVVMISRCVVWLSIFIDQLFCLNFWIQWDYNGGSAVI